MPVHIHIHQERAAKVKKAMKPARKPKEDPGALMRNLAMKLHAARSSNGQA